jgi:GxxExxY protein
MEKEVITGKIIACAYKVHNTLGSGFLEKVYERAFKIELEKSGFKVENQIPLSVYYDDQVVGNYYADLLIDGEIVNELKAIDSLNHAHEIQLVHYLNAIKKDFGLLINFGSSVQIKRKYRFYTKTQ